MTGLPGPRPPTPYPRVPRMGAAPAQQQGLSDRGVPYVAAGIAFPLASEHLAPSTLLQPGRGWGEASDAKFKGENLVMNNITISIQYFSFKINADDFTVNKISTF